jgi:hypothetical protein
MKPTKKIDKKKHKKEERKRKEGKTFLPLFVACVETFRGNTHIINRSVLLVTIRVVRNTGFCLLDLHLFICSAPFSKTKLIVSLNSIKSLLLITDTEYFLCGVRNNIRLTETSCVNSKKFLVF